MCTLIGVLIVVRWMYVEMCLRATERELAEIERRILGRQS